MLRDTFVFGDSRHRLSLSLSDLPPAPPSHRAVLSSLSLSSLPLPTSSAPAHVNSSRPPNSFGHCFVQPQAPSTLFLDFSLPQLPSTAQQLSSTSAALARPRLSSASSSATRPAPTLFGLSNTPGPDSLQPQPLARPHSAVFDISQQLARSQLSSKPDVQPATHNPRDAARGIPIGNSSHLCHSLQFAANSYHFFFLLHHIFSALFSYQHEFFHTTHWRGSIVVFLPRTLHTNSIYNFCTFLFLSLSYTHNFHATHSYSRTHVLPLQIGTGTRAVNLTLSLSPSPPCLFPRGDSISSSSFPLR